MKDDDVLLFPLISNDVANGTIWRTVGENETKTLSRSVGQMRRRRLRMRTSVVIIKQSFQFLLQVHDKGGVSIAASVASCKLPSCLGLNSPSKSNVKIAVYDGHAGSRLVLDYHHVARWQAEQGEDFPLLSRNGKLRWEWSRMTWITRNSGKLSIARTEWKTADFSAKRQPDSAMFRRKYK